MGRPAPWGARRLGAPGASGRPAPRGARRLGAPGASGRPAPRRAWRQLETGLNREVRRARDHPATRC